MNDSEILFITDALGNKTHAIVPMETYKSLIALREMLRATAPVSSHEIYTLSVKGICARGYPCGQRSKPDFVIIKASQAVMHIADSLPEHIRNFREKLLQHAVLTPDASGRSLIFSKDFKFQSPSFAAAMVTGNVRNGLDVWLNREGFSLKKSGYGVKGKSR